MTFITILVGNRQAIHPIHLIPSLSQIIHSIISVLISDIMELDIDPRSLSLPRKSGFVQQCGFSKSEQGIISNLMFTRITNYFKTTVNPIVANDFKLGTKVKFKGGRISSTDKSIFEKYMGDVKKMNVWQEFNSSLSSVCRRICNFSTGG